MVRGTLEIRQYQDSDNEAVRQLHYQTLAPTGALLPGGPWVDDLDDVQKHYLDNGGEFLIGVLENKIVCMCLPWCY